MAAWTNAFGTHAPDYMCVNIASHQFTHDGLVDDVRDALSGSELPAGRLKLEVTESAFLDDLEHVRSVMHAVRRAGVTWSLDDFGTGYSSLSYLQQLRAATLKIDRAFVSRIDREDNSAVLVNAIASLAHALGMDVVAEGVETRRTGGAAADDGL